MVRRISFEVHSDSIHIVLRPEDTKLLLDLAREIAEGLELGFEHSTLLQDEEETRAKHRELLEARADRLQRISVQIYRLYRRSQAPKSGAPRRETMKLLAETFDLDVFTADFLLRRRRREVLAYARKRRDRSVIRLYHQGLSNRAIVEKVGIGFSTVTRILRDYRRARL